MANPRKPRRLKLIEGTNRPCRDKPELELPHIAGLPDPPQFLDRSGADEFTRIAGLLHSNGVLTEADFGVLTAYSATWAAMVRQWEQRLSPTPAQVNVFRQLCGELGLSPAARAKLPPASPPRAANRFANSGKPPKAR